jgi:mono/diheme cytochrome c family protein
MNLRMSRRFTPKTAVVLALAVVCATASAQKPKPQKFSAKQIRAGAALFAQNCAPCHGAHMADPEGAFDLRFFPHDQHDRFVDSVTHGKNSMPPWGGALKQEEIEALWAYVVAGEKPENKGAGAK